MNRREFLKSSLAAAALAAIPIKEVEAFVSGAVDRIYVDGFYFDYTTKTIYPDPEYFPDGIEIRQIYDWLKANWKEDDHDFKSPLREYPDGTWALHELTFGAPCIINHTQPLPALSLSDEQWIKDGSIK